MTIQKLKFNSKSELEKWLKENRGKADFVVKNEKGEIIDEGEIDLGFVGNIAKEIVRPIRNLIASTIPVDALGAGKKDMSVAEQVRFQKNPTGFRIQQTIGTAASALPVGKIGTIGKAVLSGGLAGIGGSFAKQDIDNINTEELLTAGALGGITGGILQKLGQVIGNKTTSQVNSAATNVSKKFDTANLVNMFSDAIEQGKIAIQKNNQNIPEVTGNILQRVGKKFSIEPKLKASATRFDPDFFTNLKFQEAAIDQLYDVAKNSFPLLRKTAKNEQVLFDAFAKAYRNVIDKSGVQIGLDDVAKSLVNKQILDEPVKAVSELQNIFKKYQITSADKSKISKLFENEKVSASDFFDAIKELRKEALVLQNKERLGTLTKPEDIKFKRIAEEVENVLFDKLSEKYPALQGAREVIKGMFDSAPARSQYFNQTDNVSQAGALRLGDTIQKTVLGNVGYGMELAGDVLDKAKNLVPKVKLDKPANTLIPRLAGGAVKLKPGLEESIDIPEEKNILKEDQQVLQDFDLIEKEIEKSVPFKSKEELLQEGLKLSGGKLPSALSYARFMFDAQKLGVEETKQKARASIGLQGVKQIENALQTMDANQLTLMQLFPNLVQSQEAQMFRLGRNYIVEAIGRILTGATITESEEKRYLSMIPEFGDKPEIIKRKISLLKQFFKDTAPRLLSNKSAAVVVESESGFEE